MGMIDFDKPLVTKDQGHSVRVLGTLNTLHTTGDTDKQFSLAIGIQLERGNEIVRRCNRYGEVDNAYITSVHSPSNFQVVNHKVKVTRWINVERAPNDFFRSQDDMWDTEDQAINRQRVSTVATIKIEFEV